MASIHRHLEVTHQINFIKSWECDECGLKGDGITLKGHYQRNHKTDLSIASASEASNLTVGHGDTGGASPLVTDVLINSPINHQLETQDILLTPTQITVPRRNPLIEPTNDSNWLHQISTSPEPVPEIINEQEPMHTETAQVQSPFSQNREEVSQRGQKFPDLWEPFFLNCQTLDDLDSVLERCVSDWVLKSQPHIEPSPETRPPRENRGTPKNRNQSRQMQKARRSSKADDARKIQRLFNIYPRRAVRQVLGERSLPYTGTREAAAEFLHATYEQTRASLQQCQEARVLYDTCDWSTPTQDQLNFLNRPPTKDELVLKLRRATNTSPGVDGLEYRHIKALDPECILLETVCGVVWRLGIPRAWKKSRTVPVYKKGDTSDYSNFRPISLLPTIYKLFSGVISQRLTLVASDLGWLSPEQKGFLPGVHGIQEHTQLLQSVVEEAKSKRRHMCITWLDMCNAFGSVPHTVLGELFKSLPIPADLRNILVDIYVGNQMDFVLGKESICISPTAGVRQGDALSCPVFNLASEPLLRAAKSQINPGYNLFGQLVRATAYADDLAVVCNGPDELQNILNILSSSAKILGLQFNAAKCASLVLDKGKCTSAQLFIQGTTSIRCLGSEDQETYLGTPIGVKLRFRPPSELLPNLDKLAASLLAPWQKLEIFRSHLLPSLSHHLASGRVLKDVLFDLDKECRKFLGLICNLPNHASVPFFYADRRVGGLGTTSLNEEADIWTIARAAQLLTSQDLTVRNVFREQLHDTIRRGFRTEPTGNLPVGAYLSGSMEGGLYRLRYAEAGSNLWTLSRKAAKRLGVRIDVSGDETLLIVADDVSVTPAKAVRGLRKAVRQRHTRELISERSHQGVVAAGLSLETQSKDMARLLSCRTPLSFSDWRFLHRARLDILPLRGYPWFSSEDQNKDCRRCGKGVEDGFHVLNNCEVGLQLATLRHNTILNHLTKLLVERGFTVNVDKHLPGSALRPDLEFQLSGSRVMIDVTVPFDSPGNLESAYQRKVAKYSDFGRTLPLVVGSLGSWYPGNEDIRSTLGIDGRSWGAFRFRARTAAVQGSMRMVEAHLFSFTTHHENTNSPT